ncbi:MAG: hypothetical protein AB8I08_25090 [Sandaracinaceae bacterium]
MAADLANGGQGGRIVKRRREVVATVRIGMLEVEVVIAHSDRSVARPLGSPSQNKGAPIAGALGTLAGLAGVASGGLLFLHVGFVGRRAGEAAMVLAVGAVLMAALASLNALVSFVRRAWLQGAFLFGLSLMGIALVVVTVVLTDPTIAHQGLGTTLGMFFGDPLQS